MSEPYWMPVSEYLAALETLGLNPSQAGVWLGVSKQSGRAWGRKGPPPPVGKLVRLLLALKMDANHVNRWLGDPPIIQRPYRRRTKPAP